MERWDVDPSRSPDDAAAVRTISDYVTANPRGNLYRVRIKGKAADLLDWDANAREQPPGVGLAYERAGLDLSGATTGEDAYSQLVAKLGSRRAASKALLEAGVRGIRYLDQFSRADVVGGRIDAARLRGSIKTQEGYVESTEALLRQSGDEAQKARFQRDIDAARAKIEAMHAQIADAEKAAAGGTRNFVIFSDNDVEITHKNGVPVAKPQPRKAPTKAKEVQSLHEFIASRGGISDKDPLAADVLQSFGGKSPTVRGLGKLVRPGGKSVDSMREAAVEAGYLHDAAAEHGGATESTVNDLLDAIDAEARGAKQYPAGAEGYRTKDELSAVDEQDQAQRERFVTEAKANIEDILNGRGVTTIRGPLSRRALSIMEKDGVRDPQAAVEQALREYDVLPDRPLVAGDELPNVDADLEDWRQFGDARPEYEDPQLVAESKEAEVTPEPGSVDPAKTLSAAEQAARDADQLLEDMRPMLSEEEQRQIDDVLQGLDREREENSQIIKDGAACLAAAAA
jgi:hypothetical protein